MQELDAHGGGTKRAKQPQSQHEMEEGGLAPKRRNRQQIRPPPTDVVQRNILNRSPNRIACPLSTQPQCLVNSTGGPQYVANAPYIASADTSLNSVSPNNSAGISASPGRVSGPGTAPSRTLSQEENISSDFSVLLPESTWNPTELPFDVDCDGVSVPFEDATRSMKIQEILKDLMAEQPSCVQVRPSPAPAASPPEARERLSLVSGGGNACGLTGFANIVNGRPYFQPSGPPVAVTRAVPFSAAGSAPFFLNTTVSAAAPSAAVSGGSSRLPPASVFSAASRTLTTVPGRLPAFSGAGSLAGVVVVGPPSVPSFGPASVPGDECLALSPPTALPPPLSVCGLSSAHGGSNSSISSSCSGSERSAVYPPSSPNPLPPAQRSHVRRHFSGGGGSTSGGSVTCLSPEVSSPPRTASLFNFRTGGGGGVSSPSGDSWPSSYAGSPAGRTFDPRSPELQRSPGCYNFPPTPSSSDSDCQSPAGGGGGGGGCLSPGSARGGVPATTHLAPDSPFAAAPTQSPLPQQAEFSPPRYHASASSPPRVAWQTSTPQPQPNFLVRQEESAVYTVTPEDAGREDSGGEEVEVERVESPGYSQEALLPAEVLDGVCDGNGDWVKDDEGDT